jgi:hypothetical protein
VRSLARIGADGGTRTPNRPITSRVRYQLRHAGGHGTTSRDKSRDTGPADRLPPVVPDGLEVRSQERGDRGLDGRGCNIHPEMHGVLVVE